MGNVTRENSRRWVNGVIPFVINNTHFPAGSQRRQFVEDAIAHWNQETVVNLRPRSSEADYVEFVEASESCSSAVGRQGGRQAVRCDVGNGFSTGSMIHEIGHAVGFYHEHTRSDRAQFVTVQDLPANHPAYTVPKHNYEIRKPDSLRIGPYDYGSIMHYPEDQILSSPNPVGQRNGLSRWDIATVRQISAKWVSQSNGQAPGNAFSTNGLIIVRSKYQDGIHPGKLWLQWAHIPWGGQEHLISSYDVLCDPSSELKWVSASGGQAPDTSLIGGYVSSAETNGASFPLYIVRAKVNNETHPGKLWKQWAHIPWGGQEHLVSNYQVLCLKNV